MKQPIKKRILEQKPELAKPKFNTLLVDGSNLMEVCWSASDEFSSDGRRIGGIYQFLYQIRNLLEKGNFRHVYVFFDGENSGEMRHNVYYQYKGNRQDKTFSDDNLSDYMKEVNARIRFMQNKMFKKPKRTESEKENFFWQKETVMKCLEELFVRVVSCDKTEADDMIGYYVTHKAFEERIVICSNDRDLTQLISEDVIVYVQKEHEFINTKNYKEKLGCDYRNIKLKKVICGDASDNIKGIKGVGEKTFLENFPEIREREVTLEEIKEKARRINEERAAEKKKPLKWAENIVNAVTDGCQGEKVYEINDLIIDLHNPLMPEEAKELVESYIGSPMDPEDRSFNNLYRILMEAGIDSFRDENRFGNFFNIFNYLIDSEKKFAQSCCQSE